MSSLLDQTGKTFGGLLLQLAEALNLAEHVGPDGAACPARLPADVPTLDTLKRTVNTGLRMFLGGADPADLSAAPYTRWTFLDRRVTIALDPTGAGPLNVAGNPARYRLPAGVASAPRGPWMLSNGGHAYPVVNTHPTRVATALVQHGPGQPRISACRPIANPDGPAGGAAWEVLFAPAPAAADVAEADFRLVPPELVELEDRHPCGAQHDHAVFVFALLAYKQTDPGEADLVRYERGASTALRASIALDKDMVPSRGGRLTDPGCSIDGYGRNGRRFPALARYTPGDNP